MHYCRDLCLPTPDGVAQTRLLVVRQLAGRLLRLDEDIAAITAALEERVRALATPLLQVRGVGVVVAARLVGELACAPRVHSAAALAALAGIAPLAVASGGRHGHRVNPGGNRKLNRAIHIVALTQRRCEPLAQAYYEKKRAEGKTARAAMRCLKRRLVDVLFRRLQPARDAHPSSSTVVAA